MKQQYFNLILWKDFSILFSIIVIFLNIFNLILSVARIQTLVGDASVMTYQGHSVLHTLIRSKFSPAFTTGQRYIYTGCATGSACSK